MSGLYTMIDRKDKIVYRNVLVYDKFIVSLWQSQQIIVQILYQLSFHSVYQFKKHNYKAKKAYWKIKINVFK